MEGAGRAVGFAVILSADPMTASHAGTPETPMYVLDDEAALPGHLEGLWSVDRFGLVLRLGEVRGRRLGDCD
jgi:hypothetical protein